MSTGCQSQQSHGSEQGVRDFLAIPVIGIGFADNTENTENTDNQCENIIWSTKPSYWVLGSLFRFKGQCSRTIYTVYNFENLNLKLLMSLWNILWDRICEIHNVNALVWVFSCSALPETWDTSDIWSEWWKDKKTKKQNDKKTKRKFDIAIFSTRLSPNNLVTFAKSCQLPVASLQTVGWVTAGGVTGPEISSNHQVANSFVWFVSPNNCSICPP